MEKYANNNDADASADGKQSQEALSEGSMITVDATITIQCLLCNDEKAVYGYVSNEQCDHFRTESIDDEEEQLVDSWVDQSLNDVQIPPSFTTGHFKPTFDLDAKALLNTVESNTVFDSAKSQSVAERANNAAKINQNKRKACPMENYGKRQHLTEQVNSTFPQICTAVVAMNIPALRTVDCLKTIVLRQAAYEEERKMLNSSVYLVGISDNYHLLSEVREACLTTFAYDSCENYCENCYQLVLLSLEIEELLKKFEYILYMP